MDDEITFVPKSQRNKERPQDAREQQKTLPKKKTVIKSDAITNEDRAEIRSRYSGIRVKTHRNVTAPHLESWSALEDTSKSRDGEKELTLDTEKEEFSVHRRKHAPSQESQVKRKSRLWRSEHDVSLISRTRVDVPPLIEWRESLPAALCDALVQRGYGHPLPVQSQCISLALAGYDVIGLAQTGTGKTLAYVVPMLVRVLDFLSRNEFDPVSGPLGVALVPTHELAEQVNGVIEQLCQSLGISTMALVGGFSISEQALTLRKGAHVVVATPGRLCDIIESSLMVIGNCSLVVMDEADKMVDRSFGPQIDRILGLVPSDRRLMMFSATMPNEVLSIVERFFTNVVRVRVGKVGDASTTIKQIVHYVTKTEKRQAFLEAIHGMKAPIIVFVNSRESCESVANLLGDHGFRVSWIHGGKSQKDRDAVVNAILDGVIDIVVATEVLSRGIDIERVQNVVNYEMPVEISSYVHRIGRTGRAGAAGVATSFVTPDDTYIMYDLVKLLQRNSFAVPQGMLQNPASQHRVEFDPKSIKVRL